MELMRAGSRPTKRAPEAYFTGEVYQDPVIEAPAPAQLRSLVVHFMPGARTHWHTHPRGQTLHVLSGVGRFQTDGEALVELRPGDTVWIPPGERHWHGAAPGTAMVHIAMQEADPETGSAVTWEEAVDDETASAEIG
ncbi:MAG: cupin domain-containing protein [Pseudomonadota bacterium]